jgi:hypothetical protein
MRRRALLKAHEASWKSSKKGANLLPLKLAPHDAPAAGVCAVNLEDAHGEIKTNRGSRHGGQLLFSGVIQRPPCEAFDAVQ